MTWKGSQRPHSSFGGLVDFQEARQCLSWMTAEADNSVSRCSTLWGGRKMMGFGDTQTCADSEMSSPKETIKKNLRELWQFCSRSFVSFFTQWLAFKRLSSALGWMSVALHHKHWNQTKWGRREATSSHWRSESNRSCNTEHYVATTLFV